MNSMTNQSHSFVDLGDKILIKVNFLKANTVLNCPTYDKEGNLVHDAYTPFTDGDIKDLINSGIDEIFYSKVKSESQQILFNNNLKEYLSNNVYDGPRSISIETQQKAVDISQKIEQAIKNQQSIDLNGTQDVISQIFSDLSGSNTDIINLIDIQSFDDQAHAHCLNVGVSSMAFARKLGMPEDQVKEIGLAGFLHDIGMIRLPFALVKKPGTLSPKEFEIVKKHPRYSYEIVKESTQISETVKKIILLHHEKFDGTGYPFGFKDSQIDEGVYVVAIAEVYDALTTKSPYRDAISSKEALKFVIKNAGTHFKPELAHRFSKNMGVLFKESNFLKIGNFVLLNTNETGKIIYKDSETTTQPVIEIVKNSLGKRLTKPIQVDLRLDSSRSIIKLVEVPEII